MSMNYDTTSTAGIYGLTAEFEEAEQLVHAARRARQAGYHVMDAYSPFPIEELPDALGLRRTRLPWFVLLGAIVGGVGGYLLQWYPSVVSYPWNIGGRPYHSWPAFIPVTFEMAILGAALTAVIGMFIGNRLPMPYHAVFNTPGFSRASRDRFFLCIESSDPQYDAVRTRAFLASLSPIAVREVQH